MREQETEMQEEVAEMQEETEGIQEQVKLMREQEKCIIMRPLYHKVAKLHVDNDVDTI